MHTSRSSKLIDLNEEAVYSLRMKAILRFSIIAIALSLAACAGDGKMLGTKESRNAERQMAVASISNAIKQYEIDYKAHPEWYDNVESPYTFPSIAQIGSSGVKEAEICRHWDSPCEGMATLKPLEGTYLHSVFVDPLAPKDSDGTGYFITEGGGIIAKWER